MNHFFQLGFGWGGALSSDFVLPAQLVKQRKAVTSAQDGMYALGEVHAHFAPSHRYPSWCKIVLGQCDSVAFRQRFILGTPSQYFGPWQYFFLIQLGGDPILFQFWWRVTTFISLIGLSLLCNVVVTQFSLHARIIEKGSKNLSPLAPFYLFIYLFKLSRDQLACTNSIRLGQESFHSGSANCDDCGRTFPSEVRVNSFPW